MNSFVRFLTVVVAALGLLMMVGAEGSDCHPEPIDPVGCYYEGDHYNVGESFAASDGCNTCKCTEDGTVACTEMACAGCTYDGNHYNVGDSFPASDGCNTCTCMDTNKVACTLMACIGCNFGGSWYEFGDTMWAMDACNKCTCMAEGVACTKVWCPCTGQEWFREYMSKDLLKCAAMDFACPDNTHYFENDCGCGCQQSPDCPEWFNCMPPIQCDVAKIKEDCPYSDIAW